MIHSTIAKGHRTSIILANEWTYFFPSQSKLMIIPTRFYEKKVKYDVSKLVFKVRFIGKLL